MPIVNPKPPTAGYRVRTVDALIGKYPFLRRENAGKSLLGREISLLSLGNAGEKTLYVAGVHGSEWITVLVLLRLIERVCAACAARQPLAGMDVCAALSRRGMAFVPCLNPDGTEIALIGSESAGKYAPLVRRLSGGKTDRWQANARGIDLNHNFDADHAGVRRREREAGIFAPAARQYGGEAPESEPETQWLTALCRREPFRCALALHTQGEVIYWRFGARTPEKAQAMALSLSLASGYAPDDPEGIAVGGGFKDWFIQEFARPAFTIELGRGENPLPIADFGEIYAKAEKMLLLAAVL